MRSKEEILTLLRQIPDPEIPVINIDELGVVRDIIINEDRIEVVITPTYTGCPAMKMIEDEIIQAVQKKNVPLLLCRTGHSARPSLHPDQRLRSPTIAKGIVAPLARFASPGLFCVASCTSSRVNCATFFASPGLA
jgi:ring-1,2-phenylacetyl-CoA epoxidase subunit PaaD